LQTADKLTTNDKLLFALIFFGLALRLLFAPPIWNRGEAREGLVVQGIVHNQQWILPFRNGELPSKPPLFHWLAATGTLIVGESDFSTRLPSAVGAAVLVIVTFIVGRAMGGRRTGWLATGALLGMYDFWHAAGQARVDMVFSACVAGAIAGFYFWYRDGSERARTTCYLATVCAVFAKGPLGIALVGLVILSFLVFEKRPRLLWTFWSWPLIGLALVVIGGWYGWAYAIGGERFVAWQIGVENIERFVGGDAFPRQRMYLNTAIWLATRTLPWNFVLLWSVFRWRRGIRENSDGRLLHAWWLAMFCLFSASAFARAVYFLPLLPAIAVLAGRALNTILSEHSAVKNSGEAHHPAVLPRRYAATWIGITIVLCDLIFMFVSYGTWRDEHQLKARLAFEKKIKAVVPAQAPFFAAPMFDIDDVMVLAYRLKRQIERKPLTCAKPNDYFLLSTDKAAAGEVRVLAMMDRSQVALVQVIGERPAVGTASCQNQNSQSTNTGDL
jgi:4-amino-4-deoxy-L-arabinose transferase-like glycosyltransferase